MEHTLTKGGWTFTVPALGGNNAKEKHDIIIKHEGYFNSPINIELKTNISGLAYSTHAQALYNEHIGEKNSSDRTSAGKSREYYGTSIMQDYLKGENIDIEGNSPIDVLIKYREHIQKKNEELESPMPLDEQKEKQEEIDKELDDSKEKLDKNKKKDASDSQKSAGDKMEEMAQTMPETFGDRCGPVCGFPSRGFAGDERRRQAG